MRDLEGVLGPTVISFVERHIDSLLAWDVVVFFDRNPDAKLDAKGLSAKLGRHENEVAVAVDRLCEQGVLIDNGGRYSMSAQPEIKEQARRFAEACSVRGQRLALIALVLQRMGHATR